MPTAKDAMPTLQAYRADASKSASLVATWKQKLFVMTWPPLTEDFPTKTRGSQLVLRDHHEVPLGLLARLRFNTCGDKTP